jgi:Domain of Unknown Function (DUF326)
MSIELMISEHPDVGADYNPTLGMAVRVMGDCAAICNSCADACTAEEMDMRQCIRTCIDCSDLCFASLRIAMRRTGSNRDLIRAQLAVCIKACEICAEECAKHHHPHCMRCATMCRECAQACRDALEDLVDEVHAEA